MADVETLPPEEEKPAAELPGLSEETVRAVIEALDDEFQYEVRTLVQPLHNADLADLIEFLSPERRAALIEMLRGRFDPEILAELDPTVRQDVVDHLGIASLARGIVELDTDDALNLIETLDEAQQRQVLQAIPNALRAMIEEGLAFPEESAGRLMQREFVAVPSFWSVGEVIDYLREADSLPEDFYDLFVVDPRHRPVGKVALSHVLRSKRPTRISDIMITDIVTIPAVMDQEEVAYAFAQQNLVSAPVIDDTGRLIGAIMVDDIVDVIQAEAEEDIMRLGGVKEDDLYEAVIDTGRSRFPWLFVNLLTAALASLVIGLFEGTIQQLVVLAVLMPIVASMGGNAGTQTLTVVVRALAMKELTAANAWRVLSKEILVGGLNGILFAALISVLAWVWSGDIHVGFVMGLAMIITMVIAGLAGMAIPFGLARTGVDPAIASGVFLTTVTDVVGFFVFLGLAAVILL